jgi:hypothetical protein
MDPISVDANPGSLNKVPASSRLPATPSMKLEIQASEGHALTDLGKLAERVDSSSAAIRPEVVERGKALLSDPNWPNESILEGLSEKLIDNEDFDT